MRQETLRRFISLGLLVVLVLVFSFTSEYFFTAGNLLNLLRESAIVGILAIGVTTVIITGGNDLSCGALLGLNAMIVARLIHYTDMSMISIWAIAFGSTLLCGLFNGFLVAILRIPDFIATLSSQFVFGGLTLILAIRTPTGMITSKTISEPFIKSLGGNFGGLFYVTIVFFAMAAIGQFILKGTKFGVHVYAIGSNRNSAELSGISFVKTKFGVFLISAICAHVGALFLLGKIGAAEVDTGLGLEFAAISATVIGGCSFAGGRGDVIGTTIGVLFLKALENGVLKYGITTEMQQIVSGLVIVSMLVFDAVYNRYMTERTTKAAAIAREKKAVEA